MFVEIKSADNIGYQKRLEAFHQAILDLFLEQMQGLLKEDAPMPQLSMRLLATVLKSDPDRYIQALVENDLVGCVLKTVVIRQDLGDQVACLIARPSRSLLWIVSELLHSKHVAVEVLFVDHCLLERVVVVLKSLLEVYEEYLGNHEHEQVGRKLNYFELEEWFHPMIQLVEDLISLAQNKAMGNYVEAFFSDVRLSKLLQIISETKSTSSIPSRASKCLSLLSN